MRNKQEVLNRLREDKILSLEIVVALTGTIFYMSTIFMGLSSILAISNMFLIGAILSFSRKSLVGLILFAISDIFSALILVPTEGLRASINKCGPEVIISTIGCILVVSYYILNSIHSKDANKSISNIFKQTNIPKKAPIWARVLMYLFLVSSVLAMHSYINSIGALEYGVTWMSTLWLLCPTFYTIATVLRISDNYILRLINQIVMIAILYMQYALGTADYINIASVLIITICLLVGYMDYIKINKRV